MMYKFKKRTITTFVCVCVRVYRKIIYKQTGDISLLGVSNTDAKQTG